MEEFIFGTFATDQLKLMHHRASLSGVQHQHMLVPADPLPGQSIIGFAPAVHSPSIRWCVTTPPMARFHPVLMALP